MKNLEAVDEAMTWLGTPYHHQGRVKGVGVDCWRAYFLQMASALSCLVLS